MDSRGIVPAKAGEHGLGIGYSNIGSCRAEVVSDFLRLAMERAEVPTTPRNSVCVRARRGIKTRWRWAPA